MTNWTNVAQWIAIALTLIISIISPIITAYINNTFQLKMADRNAKNKEIENYYLRKRAVIDSFVATTGKCLFHATTDSLQACGESFYSIYIYVPSSLWNEIDDLLVFIRAHEFEKAQSHFAKLSKSLSDLLEREQL